MVVGFGDACRIIAEQDVLRLKMHEKITIEISKEDYFKNWEPEQLARLTEEQKKEIIKFFINRGLCLKRDGYKCQNAHCTQHYNSLATDERKKVMTVHHITPRRDFKENPNLVKHFGYE